MIAPSSHRQKSTRLPKSRFRNALNDSGDDDSGDDANGDDALNSNENRRDGNESLNLESLNLIKTRCCDCGKKMRIKTPFRQQHSDWEVNASRPIRCVQCFPKFVEDNYVHQIHDNRESGAQERAKVSADRDALGRRKRTKCKHCGSSTHLTIRSKQCPKNPKYVGAHTTTTPDAANNNTTAAPATTNEQTPADPTTTNAQTPADPTTTNA